MAQSRHKRPNSSWQHASSWMHLRRFAPIVGPLAALAIVATGSAGVPDDDRASAASQSYDSVKYDRTEANTQVSRGSPQGRAPLSARSTPTLKPAKPKPAKPPKAVGKRFVTTDLNIRTTPSETAKVVNVLSTGSRVAITAKSKGQWAELAYKGKSRWVKAEYLAKNKPKPEEKKAGGISGAPCKSGSEVEEGLQPDAVKVHRAVCANFPDVSSYGGMRTDGEHGDGQALDIMVSGDALGDEIADWVRANAGKLGVTEVIWSQQIWTTQRGSEGWRSMEDRGSPTANHMDHVHVTVG